MAKGVRLHAVRVLDREGLGTPADVVAAVDRMTAHALRPAVVTLSLDLTGPAPVLAPGRPGVPVKAPSPLDRAADYSATVTVNASAFPGNGVWTLPVRDMYVRYSDHLDRWGLS